MVKSEKEVIINMYKSKYQDFTNCLSNGFNREISIISRHLGFVFKKIFFPVNYHRLYAY